METEAGDSRTRLLDAGVELLHERLAWEDLAALEVARRAKLSRGSFYNHWRSRDEFARDLLEHMVRMVQTDAATDVINQVNALLSEKASPRTLVREVAATDIERVSHDPTFLLELALIATSRRDPRVADAVSDLYEAWVSELVPMYELALDALGYEMRPPFTEEDLARGLMGLVEGLALQRTVDPVRLHRDLFGNMTLALLPGMVRKKGDDRELSGFLDSNGIPDERAADEHGME